MSILKKVVAAVLCSAMMLCMGFSAMAAESPEKTEGTLVIGSLDNRVAVSSKNMDKGLQTSPLPKLKETLGTKALWEFGIRGATLYPIGEKDGQMYTFGNVYFNFGGTVANPINKWEGYITKEAIQEVVALFEANGYTHVGWQHNTLYQIRSSLIPKFIKYWTNSYGTGLYEKVDLNSSHKNYNGSFSVMYGLGNIPTAPYTGWTYGDYNSMFADQVSIIEFLCSVDFNY